MYHALKPGLSLILLLVLLPLAACGPSPEALSTQIAGDFFATQTALAPPATLTPTITPTLAPSPTATLTPIPTETPTPTPTKSPCGNVDLNGRYVDFRTVGGVRYGWVMDAEQTGCEFNATEYFYLKARGPGSMGYAKELTGTIEGDRLQVCYTVENYCLNLVIFGGGDTLVNGIEGWQYEKSGPVPDQGN